jgi:hypothetical protein
MPALNFKAEFVPKILDCSKCQTIRARRRDGRPHARSGDRLKLYTGMRTRACCLVATVWVTNCEGIVIHTDGIEFRPGTLGAHFWSENLPTKRVMLDSFAKRDGFKGWTEMREWFAKVHGLPFEGTLISWAPSVTRNRQQTSL